MNIKRNILSIALAAAVVLPSFASNAPTDIIEPSSSAIKEITLKIKNVDFDYAEYNKLEIMLKFMVNQDNELIVLSTDDSEIDATLKSALNYKSIDTKEFKPYKVYILPIRFEAK